MKVLYWHLTPEDVAKTPYPQDKLIHWEIRSFINQQSYISLYWFKAGVPFDKEPINGLALYGYEADELRERVKDFIHQKFGGELMRRAYRIFFDNCKIIKDNTSLAELAEEIDKRFNTVSEIWLEFDGIDEEESKRLFKKPIVINK